MNIDAKLIFSEEQALVATADSTNTVDLFNTTHGSGGPLWLVIIVTESFVTATSYEFELEDSADDSSFASLTVPITTGAVAVATLVAGYTAMKVPLPDSLRRYSKLVCTEVGSTGTAGKITAFITDNPDASL